MSSDDIQSKIRAILRRADESRNDSEEEREVAMRMAQKLLLEHGLTMADLGNLDDEDLPSGRKFGRDHAFVTARTESWRGSLLARIATVYFAKAYYVTRHHSRIWYILGRQDHVQTTFTMFNWVEPQLEAEFNRQVEHMGPYQQGARKFALLASGVPIYMLDRPLEGVTDVQLAEMGAQALAKVKRESGADASLEYISGLVGCSKNYAKHIRVHINKRDIAPTVATDLGSWRKTWFDYAISALSHRLDAIQREEAEKFGSKGTDLIVNERGALDKFMKDELGLELVTKKSNHRVNAQAANAGARAGNEADIRPGHRVGSDSGSLLGSG